MTGVIGAIVLAVVIVVVIPVGVLLSGAAAAVVLGEGLRRDAVTRYEGSELLALDG